LERLQSQCVGARETVAKEAEFMCGFCGELNFSERVTPSAIAKMLGPLATRGPDAAGMFVQEKIGFGHRRLSILDLAPTSQQPMIDPVLGLAIVFNGCIYNFRQLRDELMGLGYQFFSEGDTEVILKAYDAWGWRCVERFAGMFAFALWERDSGRVVLARDRLGIKPLYIADTHAGLRFASTLQALLATADVDTTLDPIALHHYMSWHAVVPAPHTILNGVRKLRPASVLIIEPDGRRQEERYWSFTVGSKSEASEIEWRDRLMEALARAVERRTVADVPVGVLLSGGLDSSILVALLAERAPAQLKTFSIGFESVGEVAGDEFQYSDLIAQKYGTEHHQIRIGASELVDALPATIAAMSEPMMSHDAVGFYLLSREVAKHVKVVQSGQGADEIFGGYHWYQRLQHSNDVAEEYARVYFDRTHDEMREALDPQYLNGDYSSEYVQKFFDQCGACDPVDKVLQIDSEIMLIDDPVKRVDNMTMAWGLEGRVPFLDHELVELAAQLPSNLKLRNGGKYILKDAARGLVPDDVIDRPKGYFPVPALKFLRGPSFEFVRQVLNEPRARERNLFRRDYVERLLANPEGELTPKGHSKLWQVAVLEHWLQCHGV
jgi:asparagine synthase (glutamine-hydrolysing)